MELLQKHPLTAKYASLFSKFGITTNFRLAHFIGQLTAESNLKPIDENLRYSATRLLQVFGKYFKADPLKSYTKQRLEAYNQVPRPKASEYAMQPAKIANRVYANRMGNCDEQSGDGYRFRGRGFIQLTGRNNYTALTKWAQNNGLNVDYVKNPDLLLNEADSVIAALWFWTANNINQYADKDDVLRVSRMINIGNANSGTPHGYENRKAQTEKFKKVFK